MELYIQDTPGATADSVLQVGMSPVMLNGQP